MITTCVTLWWFNRGVLTFTLSVTFVGSGRVHDRLQLPLDLNYHLLPLLFVVNVGILVDVDTLTIKNGVITRKRFERCPSLQVS